MNAAVRGERFVAPNCKRLAGKIAELAAGFADDESAGGGVPRSEERRVGKECRL